MNRCTSFKIKSIHWLFGYAFLYDINSIVKFVNYVYNSYIVWFIYAASKYSDFKLFLYYAIFQYSLGIATNPCPNKITTKNVPL